MDGGFDWFALEVSLHHSVELAQAFASVYSVAWPPDKRLCFGVFLSSAWASACSPS